VYIASGVMIIAILGIILVINNFGLGVGNFSSVKLPSVNLGEQIFNKEALRDARSLVVSIKDVHVEPVDMNRAKVNVTFDIFNPNKATVMLEVISYNLFTNSGRIVSGDIGEKPTGFVGSQANIFPIVGNGSIMVKDSKVIEREGPSQTNLEGLVRNIQHYIINGTFSYKQTSSFQSSGGENNYSLPFP
jgi:hypothetical protein